MSEVILNFVNNDSLKTKYCIKSMPGQENCWHPIVVPYGTKVVEVYIPELSNQEKDELEELREVKKKNEEMFEFLRGKFPEEFENDFDYGDE